MTSAQAFGERLTQCCVRSSCGSSREGTTSTSKRTASARSGELHKRPGRLRTLGGVEGLDPNHTGFSGKSGTLPEVSGPCLGVHPSDCGARRQEPADLEHFNLVIDVQGLEKIFGGAQIGPVSANRASSELARVGPVDPARKLTPSANSVRLRHLCFRAGCVRNWGPGAPCRKPNAACPARKHSR